MSPTGPSETQLYHSIRLPADRAKPPASSLTASPRGCVLRHACQSVLLVLGPRVVLLPILAPEPMASVAEQTWGVRVALATARTKAPSYGLSGSQGQNREVELLSNLPPSPLCNLCRGLLRARVSEGGERQGCAYVYGGSVCMCALGHYNNTHLAMAAVPPGDPLEGPYNPCMCRIPTPFQGSIGCVWGGGGERQDQGSLARRGVWGEHPLAWMRK